MPIITQFFWLTPVVYTLGFMALAYAIYRIPLFALKKLGCQYQGIWCKLLYELSLPILFIFSEIAALISIHQFPLPEKVVRHIEHGMNISIIATLGWLAMRLARAFYRYFLEKSGSSTGNDMARRSLLTQTLFLYRFALFVVLVVTIGAILLTFPYIKNIGLGILGSAGIAGLALGIAAKPILLDIMVGFQIALTKTIKIGDAIFVENEFARVEEIHLTRVVACTWDLRRIVLPISYFIDKPFQNWDLTNPELLGVVYLYCDYSVPVDAVRKKAEELIKAHPNWNGRVWNVQVTDATENTVEVRIIASANDAPSAFDLRAHLREKLIDFLQKEHPLALPRVRNYQLYDRSK